MPTDGAGTAASAWAPLRIGAFRGLFIAVQVYAAVATAVVTALAVTGVLDAVSLLVFLFIIGCAAGGWPFHRITQRVDRSLTDPWRDVTVSPS
jgi:hypothetical protein